MPNGIENQPVTNIKWVERSLLRANDYNPNNVAPPELELLKISILYSGWTQPIVVREDYEIVDGFHRWRVSANPMIAAMTNGLVPVVIHPEVPAEEQKMATIRHNRARGSHHVLRMADIVRHLMDDALLPKERIQNLLGMEEEEVERLYDNSGMTNRGGKESFNKGWGPG